jgi:hypothetical protein
MMRILAAVLAIVGAIILGVGLLAAGHSVMSWLERQAHGPGPLFADVEVFALLALVCLVSGGGALLGAWKLARRRNRQKTQGP